MRKAKSFFDQEKINLVGGLSFVKTAGDERTAKALDNSIVDAESARSVEDKENILEGYLVSRAKNFFAERSINFDIAGAARSLSNAIPEDVKSEVRALVVEGRGKKKILKKILPLLGILKIKLVALAIIALLGIGLVAKKALLVSLISIALSASSFVGKLFSGKGGFGKGGGGGGHEEIVAYNTGNSGWSSGGYGGGSSGGWGGSGWSDSHGGYGEHGAYSAPIAHSVAYSAHHKASRR